MSIKFSEKEIRNALVVTKQKWTDNIIRHYFDAFRYNKKFIELGGDGAIEVLTKDIIKIREDISNEKLKGKAKNKEMIVEWENILKTKEKEFSGINSMKKEREECMSSAFFEEDIVKDIDIILKEPNKIYELGKN